MDHKEYRLKIRQNDTLESSFEKLEECIKGESDCIEIIEKPVIVKTPKLGYFHKWHSSIRMKNTPECELEFRNRISNNDHFSIQRIKTRLV
ncbi:hypothetical protein ACFO3O_09065 [Dokdonia ponticola]|uniref:Uncharacterized protein n=1 Tax=Dokdonia ponticola TaxID=2041041 RepID=A0ABV9HX46_9FLAO